MNCFTESLAWLHQRQIWTFFEEVTNSVLIQFVPEGHRKPLSKAGSLSPAGRAVRVELPTYLFQVQCLDPVNCSHSKTSGTKTSVCLFSLRYIVG